MITMVIYWVWQPEAGLQCIQRRTRPTH